MQFRLLLRHTIVLSFRLSFNWGRKFKIYDPFIAHDLYLFKLLTYYYENITFKQHAVTNFMSFILIRIAKVVLFQNGERE